MNTENVVKHLRALWRADRIIADIRLRHLLIGLGLRAFAALIAAFGLLGMCNWLSQWYQSNGPYTHQQIAAMFTQMVEGGLKAPAGVEVTP